MSRADSVETRTWADGTVCANEATMAFGLSVRGVLFDSLVTNGVVNGESTITFDGNTWIAITHQGADAYSAYGTLWVRIA